MASRRTRGGGATAGATDGSARPTRRTLLLGGLAAGGAVAAGPRLGWSPAALADRLDLVPAAGAAESEALLAQITRFANESAKWVPGCAVAAVDRIAGTSGTYATGLRDLDTGEPFTTSTIAIIDSVSKQFTTTMLAQAVVGGLGRTGPLALDGSIEPYLRPYLEAYGKVLPALPTQITLRQLADYTSGFMEEPSNYTSPAHDYDLALLTDWLSSVHTIDAGVTSGPYLHAEPGTAYHYSDVAVDLLGFILADQVMLTSSPGMPNYDDLIAHLLVGPDVLDMPDTFVTPPAAKEPRIAKGYLYDPGIEPPLPGAFHPAPKINRPPAFFGGGGGLRSTAEDMERFLHALVAPPNAGRLHEAIPLAAEPSFEVGPGRATGLGWDPIDTTAGVTILLKDGAGTAGCTSLLGYSPETGRALFWFTNVDGATKHIEVAAEFKRLLAERSPAPLTPDSTTSTTSAGGGPSSTSVPGTADPAAAVRTSPSFTG